jgi:hypothetical protein
MPDEQKRTKGNERGTARPTDAKQPEAISVDEHTSATSPREIGGRKGLDPTRYGDWEKNGRCIDF